jgi:hypothetical protein
MATTMISDQELILAITGKRMNKRFEYHVIFQNIDHLTELTFKTIWADNKIEATHVAREYGVRFLEARVVEVQKVGN